MLSPNSWHYRELNQKNPGLDHLSTGLIALVLLAYLTVTGIAASLPDSAKIGTSSRV